MRISSPLVAVALCGAAALGVNAAPESSWTCVLSAGPGATVRRAGGAYHGVGVNYFDCFLRTLKDGADTSYEKGLAVLAARGIPFARFCAAGFWPKDMDLYRQDRAEYFRRFDGVVRAAERHGVGLIPSLFWFSPCVPDLVGEPVNQWGNANSRTHAWMREYVREVVSRYRASPAIAMWEFGNEYNLVLDLPTGATHRPKVVPALGTPATRSVADELRLEDGAVALAEFARAVRALDPVRLISSGHSFPRPSAWHLHADRSWRKDDEEQFTRVLGLLHPAPVDVISVHAYREDSLDRLDWLRRAAGHHGRPVFVGEFGVKAEARPAAELRQEFERLLASILASGSPLAALWVYDYPRQAEWNVTGDNERAWQLDAVAAANRAGR